MNFKRIDRPLLDIESTNDFFSSRAEDYYFPGKITNVVFDYFKSAKNIFNNLGLTSDLYPGSTLLESESCEAVGILWKIKHVTPVWIFFACGATQGMF